MSFSKLLSVGEDSMLNIYQIEASTKVLKNIHKIDLPNEIYAMASNSVDKLALGGEENKIDIYTIPDGNIT
jgi:hypothetical protein